VDGWGDKVSFIWSVKEVLRDHYRHHESGQVILPLVVLRRLDCVLEPTHAAVFARAAGLPGEVDDHADLLAASEPTRAPHSVRRSPLDAAPRLERARDRGALAGHVGAEPVLPGHPGAQGHRRHHSPRSFTRPGSAQLCTVCTFDDGVGAGVGDHTQVVYDVDLAAGATVPGR
jgi:hypothetical protein